eukprot:TRINITY_DN37969_c0_g1_i1.p1 TRINITY_DN37969_c0_g1~~TRINITY_DN37969_c0_g1_i1.p1  ORF type:complete len:543 (+),score=162.11 TRINITY_DN37969_c0_g1_i1:65-1693(+)
MATYSQFSALSASAMEFCPGSFAAAPSPAAAAPEPRRPVVQLSLDAAIAMPAEPQPAPNTCIYGGGPCYNSLLAANAAATMLNLEMYSDDSDSDSDSDAGRTEASPMSVPCQKAPVAEKPCTALQKKKLSSTVSVTSTASEISFGDDTASADSDPESESQEAPAAASKAVTSAAVTTTTSTSLSFAAAEMLRWRSASRAAPCPTDFQYVAANVPSSSSSSWRSSAEEARPRPAASSWTAPESAPSAARHRLAASSGSWAAQQRLRRGATTASSSPTARGEEPPAVDVQRSVRSILNKLSVEKFQPLSQQLRQVGYQTVEHVGVLIKEIFEKATTQHHYIQMYTDLCELLHDHFAEHPMSEDPKQGFKRLLLIECQKSFERNLQLPEGLEAMQEDERTLAEVKYKTRMLGNIRFVGALLAHGMLASKVLMFILQELLAIPTPEALESAAALLTVAGPAFDTPEWSHYGSLKAAFMQIEELARDKSQPSRVRCLLKDVLELRASNWEDLKAAARQKEGPKKLSDIALKAAAEATQTRPRGRGFA